MTSASFSSLSAQKNSELSAVENTTRRNCRPGRDGATKAAGPSRAMDGDIASKPEIERTKRS